MQVVRMLRKHMPVVVLLCLIGAVSSYFFSQQQPAVYASTVSLVINPATPNVAIPYIGNTLQSGGSSLEVLAGTYQEYMTSEAFGKAVVEKLGLDASPGEVSGAITSSLVGSTNFFHITVRWGSPGEAERIANGVATVFIDQNRTLQQQQQAQTTSQSDAQAELGRQAQFYKGLVAALQQKILDVEQDNKLSASDKASQLIALQGQLSPLQDIYTRILSSLVSATSGTPSASSLNTAQVIDPAGPGVQVAPRTQRSVLEGTVAGLALGLGLMALLEYLDATVHTTQELEESLGAPVLGTIGMIKSNREPKTRSKGAASNGWTSSDGAVVDGAVDPKLVTIRQPMGGITESFRVLRNMVEFSNVDSPPRTLLLTSAVPGEGKTLISCNLAAVIALSGRRVILADADLHRPCVHREFGLDNTVGLTNLIASDQAELATRHEDYLVAIPSVPGLYVLPSGPMPPNPSELLGSARAAHVFQQLAELADVVIYDTPPANALSDAAVLGSRVDGVIVLVQAGKTRRDAVQHLGSHMRKVGARIIGGVLNMLPDEEAQRYYYYGRYKYQPRAVEPVATGRQTTP